MIFVVLFAALAASFNKLIKRMEWGWVLPEKQNQIAVVGRTFASPPLIANRYTQKYKDNYETLCLRNNAVQ